METSPTEKTTENSSLRQELSGVKAELTGVKAELVLSQQKVADLEAEKAARKRWIGHDEVRTIRSLRTSLELQKYKRNIAERKLGMMMDENTEIKKFRNSAKGSEEASKEEEVQQNTFRATKIRAEDKETYKGRKFLNTEKVDGSKDTVNSSVPETEVIDLENSDDESPGPSICSQQQKTKETEKNDDAGMSTDQN